MRTVDRDLLSKFAPGIAFTANGKKLADRDLVKCLRLNRRSNFGGTVFFHYEGLRDRENLF